MAEIRAFALSAVALAALSTAAAAADLLPPPPAMEPPAPISAPEMGGWYIRGDVGVGFNHVDGVSTNPSGLVGAAPDDVATEEWYNNAVSHSALFDVGIGYQVNSWFRADVTGELRGGGGYSGLQMVNVSSGTDANYQLADFYKANLTSAIGMVNAYAMLGTWYGVTPYVGAGLGVAFNNFSGGLDQGQVRLPAPDNGLYPTGGILASHTEASLAWKLMAGASFDITRNVKLDIGYAFLDYGKFKSGNSSCISGNGSMGSFFTGNCGGKPFTLVSKELTASDFKIGLRYYFDNPAPPPDVPLVRKY